jgi:hypothetical protein
LEAIVTVGAVVSAGGGGGGGGVVAETVHVAVAGVASVFDAASVARTLTVCELTERLL